MIPRAYKAGCAAAWTKFAGASVGGPAGPPGASNYRDSGSPVATTNFDDAAQNIYQNFLFNDTTLPDPSSFSQPANTNTTMQGGLPSKPFSSDTTGGLRDS